MPIRTGRNGKPAPTKSEPKVKRGIAMIGSLPITVIRRPSPVEISPLTIEPSTRPATIAMARTNSEKNSHGPNSSAIAASGPVTKIRNSAAEKAAEERGPDAEPDGAAGLAGARHREAVEGGRDRRRRPRYADEAGGDEPAGRAADIDPGHRRKPLQRVEPEGEGQEHDDRHRDGDAGKGAADDARQGAEEERQQVLPLRDRDEALAEELEHRSPPGPGAARQQHQEVVLEHEIGDGRRRERDRCEHRPLARRCGADRAPPARRRRRARSRSGSR